MLQKSLQDQTLACPTSATFAVQASSSATEQTDSEQISSAGKHDCKKHTPFVYSWNDPYVVVVVDLMNTVIVVCVGTGTSVSATSHLSEVLVLKKLKTQKMKKSRGLTSRAQCISDTKFLKKLKIKKQENIEKEEQKAEEEKKKRRKEAKKGSKDNEKRQKGISRQRKT